MRTGLYEHPCISAVINESYFLHDKTEGAVHFASFMPQMPIPTVCFAVIAVNSPLFVSFWSIHLIHCPDQGCTVRIYHRDLGPSWILSEGLDARLWSRSRQLEALVKQRWCSHQSVTSHINLAIQICRVLLSMLNSIKHCWLLSVYRISCKHNATASNIILDDD